MDAPELRQRANRRAAQVQVPQQPTSFESTGLQSGPKTLGFLRPQVLFAVAAIPLIWLAASSILNVGWRLHGRSTAQGVAFLRTVGDIQGFLNEPYASRFISFSQWIASTRMFFPLLRWIVPQSLLAGVISRTKFIDDEVIFRVAFSLS